ncbi:TonB-dependent receptor [Leisingera sp. HS039]|uniref:TonB-dependent receptor plug domain-containing protein n=1 Tax=unclassified Leisingera TaxID=2614906 RepID=UPI0010713BB3|nr:MULTISPECIES: TonB-dependent receptor [unclassified Leisingera]MBQ4826147.1 TonB-dependent receptor [Leisingera sp. HS039]QBR38630.1 TonB-dependent receptor [Leisingera sp. NJS201]
MARTSNIRLSGLLCSTALALISAPAAFAEEDEVLSLDPIIVKQRDPAGNAADRATSIYVADAEIERAAMGDLKDLFAGIASVSVGGGIPIAQKIFVNGVDMLNLAVQVDGVSQNNRTFHHVSANAFDPGLMKSVRVDPGVAPADAGPRALAGRVVMETIDAEDIIEDGETSGGRSRLSYSSNGSTAQGSLTLAGRSGGFEILGYAKRATGDNYEDGDGNEVTGSAANLTAGLLKFAYEGDQGDRIELSLQEAQDNEIRNFQPNFGSSTRGFAPYFTKRRIASLRYESGNETGLWDPSATFGFSEINVDRPSDPFGDSTSTSSSTYALTLKNDFHLSDSNTITAGVDYQVRESTVNATWVNGLTGEESKNLGVFAQARLEPTDRLSVSAGLRYDWQDFTGQDFAQTGTAFTGSTSGASGNLSLVYDLTDALSLRAGYSNVFGGYDLEDNFLFYQAWDYSALQSSRAKNIIVGADWQRGNWTLGGELFKTSIGNLRGVTRTGAVIGNDFESKGFNLAATYGWDSGFARFTMNSSDIEFNDQPAESFFVVDSGTPIGKVLAFEVQQEIPTMNLLVGGSVEAALSNDNGVYETYTQKQESYQVLNLFAEYSPPSLGNVTIRAAIDNVFDTQYADRATYGTEYTAASITSIKEPGRNISVVATLKF